MNDDAMKMSPTEPATVTMIGTGSGGLVPPGTVAKTPGHVPDIIVTVIGPIMAIAVRFGNAYLTMLVGLVAAGMTSDVIPYTDFLNLVASCAKLSIAGAGLGLLKDCVTIFSRLEGKYPLLTGSV